MAAQKRNEKQVKWTSGWKNVVMSLDYVKQAPSHQWNYSKALKAKR